MSMHCEAPLCTFFQLSVNLLKPTGYVMHQQVKHSRILHSVTLLMCSAFILEQIVTFAPYNIN